MIEAGEGKIKEFSALMLEMRSGRRLVDLGQTSGRRKSCVVKADSIEVELRSERKELKHDG